MTNYTLYQNERGNRTIFTDAAGSWLFAELCEIKPDGAKEFPVQRWIGNDYRNWQADKNWRYGLGVVPPVLYRLGDVIDAVAYGETIYICEGPKDAINLSLVYGVCATSVPGCKAGRADWDQYYTPVLKAAVDVVYIADRDSSGYRRARAAYESLTAAGVPASVVLPRPDFPGADATNHIADEHGYGLADFVPLDVAEWAGADGATPDLGRMSGDTASSASERLDPRLRRIYGRLRTRPGNREARRSGRLYFNCPLPHLHERGDARPSFNVKVMDDEVLFACACAPDRSVQTPEGKVWCHQVLDALGLDWDDIFAEAYELFPRLSAHDLAAAVPAMRWLVRGVWPEGSHGPIAGAKKTLKSYNGLALDVAIASGAKYLGHFAVERSGPVLTYVGEGGEVPFRRRYQRMCEAYGVEPADLPFHAVFAIAPLDSKRFVDSLKRDLDEIQPVAFHLDSLYNYHPRGIEVQNLYERGHLLAELSALVGDDCAMFVGDHYRKSGADKLDLDEIAQAGMAQWADSWILQSHRQEPDVDNGAFYLGAAFGSRQWGGRDWDIDFRLGRFDDALCEHDGQIEWSVAPSGPRAGGGSRSLSLDEVKTLVLEYLAAHNFTKTKSEIAGQIAEENRISDKRVKAALNSLSDTGEAVSGNLGRDENGRAVTRELWGLPDQPKLKVRRS